MKRDRIHGERQEEASLIGTRLAKFLKKSKKVVEAWKKPRWNWQRSMLNWCEKGDFVFFY